MRSFYLASALAVAMLGATAASAGQQETTPSTANGEENGAAPAKPVKPRKICREDQATYSRMPTKVCKTQAEWDALDGRNRSTRDLPPRSTN